MPKFFAKIRKKVMVTNENDIVGGLDYNGHNPYFQKFLKIREILNFENQKKHVNFFILEI